jgi:hypothetical protein
MVVLNRRNQKKPPYPVLSRLTFGIYRSYSVVILRAVLGIIWVSGIPNGTKSDVTIAAIVKRLIIHDSDTDSDKYADLGHSKALLAQLNFKDLEYTLLAMQRLESFDCKLDRLAITIGKQAPGIADFLDH